MSSLERLAEIAREYEDENRVKHQNLNESQVEQNRTDGGSVWPLALLATASIVEMGIAFQLFSDAEDERLLFSCTFGQTDDAIVRQVWIPTNATMLATFVTQLLARNGSEHRHAKLPHFDETHYGEESRRVMSIEQKSIALHFGRHRTISVDLTGEDLSSLTHFLSELVTVGEDEGIREWVSQDRALMLKGVREDADREWVLRFMVCGAEAPTLVTLYAYVEDLDRLRACATQEQVQIWGRAQVEYPVVVSDNENQRR